jgi:hypothetical protein
MTDLPEVLRLRPLRFGDAEQIAALRGFDLLELDEPDHDYEVRLFGMAEKIVVVRAADAQEAEAIAADGDYVRDGDWDIEEIEGQTEMVRRL